ncbi:MAG: diaminopimelate decarboxylase [Hadesarchaea archaeon]|nr:diaminopimelate decarboxylase [Hadesarchaea archaeon]
MKSHFSIDEQGHLVIGGVSAVELAERFGTPLYVMDEQRVRENYRRFYRAYADRWKKIIVCYAYKANSNLAVCKVLCSEGCGAEVSSECELRTALRAGVPGEHIIFNGNCKSPQELKLAIENNVLINLDSLQEIEVVDEIASKLGRKARVGIRVNPDVKAPTHPYVATGLRESKFGLDVRSGQALDGYRLAKEKENLEVVAIHSHIGSQILDPRPFEEQIRKVLEVVAKIRDELDMEIELVDLGGGIGIPYKPDEKELPPEEVASKVTAAAREAVESYGIQEPTLVFEPGRYIVADAGVLLARVRYTKERPGIPDWVAIDAGMNALIRPALYDAYHHIEVANKMLDKPTKLFNIAGPLCESGDFLGKNRKLPEVQPGDLLVIYDVGAYGLSLSSQHTAKPRPAMVLVNSGRAAIVRERESCEYLTRLDRIPEWLE